MAKTLTNANSAFALSVRGLFPVPQALQGYGTDDAFAVADVQPGEVMMGVDGKLSGGFVPYPTAITFTFQADSSSLDMFDTVLTAQNAAKELFMFDGTGIIQGTGVKYALTKGFLTSASPMPAGKKTLQPRQFTLTFETCTPSPA